MPLTVPLRARRARRLRTAVLATATALLTCAPGAQAAGRTVQGEGFALAPTSAGEVFHDGSAKRDKALKIWSTAMASKATTTSTGSVALTLRARAERCAGAPRVEVSVDGVRRLRATVSRTRFASYRAKLRLPAGPHTVSVAFVNDFESSRCDRNVFVDSIVLRAGKVRTPEPSARRTPSTTPGATARSDSGSRIFGSSFGDRRIGAYEHVVHGERMSIVDDPVLGARRKVVRMTIRDTDTGPTENPRGQLETGKFWDTGEDYYVGFSAMFGTDWDWNMCRTCWVTFHQIYGPPFDGQGPLNMNVKTNNPAGEPRITWERTSQFGYDHPFETKLVQNQWYDFVWHVKLSPDPGVGFVEIWMNTGVGWRQVPLHGQSRLHMATKIASNGSTSEGNSSNIQLYRQKGIADVATMYFAEHQVGTSFASVAPHSYE